MPIYEYRCQSCGLVSSFFTRSIGVQLEPACQHCQSGTMQRRMSKFSLGKSVESVHQNHPSRSGARDLDYYLHYYRDPRNIGRNVEENVSRYGVEVPALVRKTIDAAREGDLPEGLDL